MMTRDEVAAQVERYAPLRVLRERYKATSLNVIKWELPPSEYARIFPDMAKIGVAEYFGGVRVEPSKWVEVGKVRIVIEEPLGD